MAMPRPYNLRNLQVLQSLERFENPATHTDDAKPASQTESRKAIVCVHGILSGHDTCFDDFFSTLKEDERFEDWELCWYDYDYHKPMEDNGRELARTLTNAFSPSDHVELVCHSMGGLIARFAILSSKLDCVGRVFMLGTPNFGAFRTHQLGLFAQLTLKTTHSAYGLFCRKQGILDLTRVPELIRAFIDSGRGDYDHANHVEYVTVPGLYFDTDRSSWRAEWERWKLLFSGLELGLAVLSGLPVFHARLKRPHDGIVEASSNRMIPEGAEVPDTEKTVPIKDKLHFPTPTYSHVVHRKGCKASIHVAIQHDKRIIHLVSDLILAPSVAAWNQSRTESHELLVEDGR